MNDWSIEQESAVQHKSFIFYDSFYKAMKVLNIEETSEYIHAICNYALYEKTSLLSPKIEAMFQLIKPQIDANIKKRIDGNKGGRPKISDDKPLV
jgi:hypothetical protein